MLFTQHCLLETLLYSRHKNRQLAGNLLVQKKRGRPGAFFWDSPPRGLINLVESPETIRVAT